ncbi:hypothetical protein [Pseudoalteromonas sp. APC 3691]|uniref:hypothetical protein n=1 Tax=Pseudoalteromonas sp. APC 3691 TaxID=3035173 RepID=UPI0025B35A73|nr:hypothetical protein [Pseudoalteromonas sp. APC 3691]MDN3390875.1 hypothetical protein [Pseudoalteromonas sp. APC 3691]
MSVCANDFFSQAEYSLAHPNGEISNRCSIKNSYYAAYHRVNEILSEEPIQYKGTGTHQSFIEYLDGEAYKYETIEKVKLRRLAIYLKQLKVSRTQSDYILDDDITIGDAKTQLGLSTNLFKLCDEIESQKVA